MALCEELLIEICSSFLLSQVSLPLVEALGKESESGQWLVVFLVAKVVFNLSHWSSEESLAHTSIQLLQSVAKSIPRSA